MDVEAFKSDMAANAILLGISLCLVSLRDICKRISHSDCAVDEHGLRMKLPTWRPQDQDVETGNAL